MKNNFSVFYILLSVVAASMYVSCSSTSSIPEDDKLFIGLEPIEYNNYEKNAHASTTKEEMEYVLASAPNGALLGSSYYRTPFPVRLWIWNAFARDSSRFGLWMMKSFGSRPKLMSQVNPNLRTLVAENQLKKYGYFNSNVSYKIVSKPESKKAKVAYKVDMGPLWRIDSLSYLNFPLTIDSLLEKTRGEASVKKGDPFVVANLESERQRISSLFRNNGYYFYESGDASYLADTINNPGKVNLQILLADSLPERVSHKWCVGKVNINFRRLYSDTLCDSMSSRHYDIHFNGKRPPIRPGVILRDLSIKPGKLYSSSDEEQSKQKIQSTGLFSYTNLTFSPRDSTSLCDTLDANMDLVFDKPYDFYIESNAKGKTTGMLGPEFVMGFTKRNAFRGGEKLDINLHGSYEWQTGGNSGTSADANSYEYGMDASVAFPRLMTARRFINMFQSASHHIKRRSSKSVQYYNIPTTTVKISTNVLNRASYFKRHVVSGELTYDWWTSGLSHHSFSPLALSYEYMASKSLTFDSLLSTNPYLQISMRDQFVPKMSYTYSYSTSSIQKNPITWSTTVSEAGNVIAAGYAVAGRSWNEKDKQMFKNPFAQFVKLETDFVKQWSIDDQSSFLAHVNAGVICSYGNASQAPYYEQFYIGGANSVRAFGIRSIGPGKYVPGDGRYSYVDQTGDMKLLTNLEYRPHLFGDLYGALFLDAGNVWNLHDDDSRPGGKIDADFLKHIAVGTGVGIRYDMGMFVIRVDWGVGLHVPYDNGKGGFYNVSNFKDSQTLHLAVGYPF